MDETPGLLCGVLRGTHAWERLGGRDLRQVFKVPIDNHLGVMPDYGRCHNPAVAFVNFVFGE